MTAVMKNTYISIVFAAAALLCSSCEKFFDRAPEDKVAASLFFNSESDLQYYCNGLINTAMPAATSIALGDDMFTDFCATKESGTFFLPGDKYTPETASNWTASTFGFIRQVNYMLDNMGRAKDKVSAEKYNHYEGVARFFRAMSHFNKVRTFGDLYFIDKVVEPNDSVFLYGPRQDREYVMHRIVEDLDFACENCLTSGAGIFTDGRIYINKYVAEAYAARVCLFEAAYRKYHSVNPSTGKNWSGKYESSDDLYDRAIKYATSVKESGVFSLVSDYRKLFTSDNFSSVKNEVIWGRSFSSELALSHDLTYRFCSTTMSKEYGPTKDYVMMFLKSDGKPMPSGEISITEEFTGRDKRLAACILAPGMKRKDQNGAEVDFAPDFTWTTTGYFWVKWVVPTYEGMNMSNNMSFNSLPILRYGEVLVNLAEALSERGKMTEKLWNETIGELRKVHGGITSGGYPGSNGYVADNWLKDYYTTGVMHPATLNDEILEIRRERAVELTFEQDNRYDDLMRWNLGDLTVRRYKNQGWKGMYITKTEASSGFNFNGQKYTVSKSAARGKNNYKIASTSADRAFTLSEGTYGYLIYNFKLTDWDDKMYLYPIPVTAANVNPNLGQNEGWQWM